MPKIPKVKVTRIFTWVPVRNGFGHEPHPDRRSVDDADPPILEEVGVVDKVCNENIQYNHYEKSYVD